MFKRPMVVGTGQRQSKDKSGRTDVDSKAKPSKSTDNVKHVKASTLPTRPKDVDAKTFDIVEDWNRTGTVPKAVLEIPPVRRLLDEERIRIFKAVNTLKLYHLQNQIMDVLWHRSAARPDKWSNLCTVAFLDEDGLAHTPWYTFALRSSVKSLMEGRVKDKRWEIDMEEFDKRPRVMKDVMIYIRRWVQDGPWKRPGQDDICDYHVHPDGFKCGSGSGAGAPPDDYQDTDDDPTESGPSNPTGGAGDTRY